MQPTPKDAHKDSALSNIAIGYRNAMYVADRVFPNVPVVKQSDYFFTFRKGAWFRNEAKPRGPGAVAAGGGYPLTSTTYTAIEYAYRHPVPAQPYRAWNGPEHPLRRPDAEARKAEQRQHRPAGFFLKDAP